MTAVVYYTKFSSVRKYLSDSFIGLVGSVFASGPPVVPDTSLLNTQQYKVRIKGKVEQSRERSSALPYTSVSKLLKREPSGRPRLKGDNFTFTLLFLCTSDALRNLCMALDLVV